VSQSHLSSTFNLRCQCFLSPTPLLILLILFTNCPQLSIVGAGHARDEEAKTKHCSQNIAGMARSYGVIALNCGQ